MATFCEIELSELEEKQFGYHSTIIPYEINHDFFMQVSAAVRDWKIPSMDHFPIFTDYWRGSKYIWEEINILISELELLNENIDTVLSVVPLPEKVWMADGRVIVGYESKAIYNHTTWTWIDEWLFSTYIEIWWTWSYLEFHKKDVQYIISLIKKKALMAKEMNKPLRFVGE